MSLSRIFRTLASFFTGQGVSIVVQLLIPPLFLNRYPSGVEVYGEWIALSAAATYLSTLNYGIQTYANNQMTIYYNRGEVSAAKTLQACAWRLVLLIIAVFALAGASVLLMPVSRWLSLTHVDSRAASLTLYLLVLQVLLTMLFSLLANAYMVIGKVHRGANWIIVERLTSTLAVAVCIWFRATFVTLAWVQLISVPVFTLCVLIDQKKTAPVLIPSLRYGSWRGIRPILKPTAHFGLLALSMFLTWQGPILLIQKLLGPSSVTIFSLARTVFSMGRQALAVLSYSLGQEITMLTGERNWPQLKKLYDLSERVVLLLVPIFSVGVLLISPLLFGIWLHKKELYDPAVCSMMALVSAAMGIKEHKYQFQSSSNEHEKLSRFTVVTYAIMLVVAGVVLKPLGIIGFMFAWLAAEIAQTIYIFRLNVRLFPPEMSISAAPLLRLVGVLALAFSLAAWPAFASVSWSGTEIVVVAAAIVSLVTLVSYHAFDVAAVRSLLLLKVRLRIRPLVPE